jgi:lipopolysaccharide/colanic/teichoic acid biosynthesis glycosyltransferase
MQVEKIKEVTEVASRPSLRVATVTREESNMFFLYIGTNENSIKFLLNTSSSGLIAENYTNAKTLIMNEEFSSRGIDVIIIDLPFSSQELAGFSLFLKASGKVSSAVPVIYTQEQLSKTSMADMGTMVDDVIDLNNWPYDFNSKVSFLKEIKLYHNQTAEESQENLPQYSLGKRIFDVVVSSILIIFSFPILLLIALAIKLESKGPLFYNAKRAGKGFKIFRFYKFRTMVVDADKKIDALAHLNQYAGSENGAKFFKIANDPRITKVGRFLRNTSLDELPQLFNVLKGDMSLVGNRPLPLYEAATLTTNEFVERFMAPAGITGLWQIKKRGQSDMSVEERISLDISYARRSNLFYDFWIMAQTPAALLQKSDV